ncbi:MAG: hypothetical protein HY927_13785 [Elusimicrobia bacterium]|nr:hypothetical protein [Elusimicrobiota bacterium]
MFNLLAAAALSVLAPGVQAAPNQNPYAAAAAFRDGYKVLFDKGVDAYLNNRSLREALPDSSIKDLELKVPNVDRPQDQGLAAAVLSMRLLVDDLKKQREQGFAVQLGQDAADPIEIHLAAIDIISEKFQLSDSGKQKARSLYANRKRMPGQQVEGGTLKTQAELALYAEAAQRLMADSRLNPAEAKRLALRAGDYAKALGGLIFIDPLTGESSIVGRSGTGALTQDELARLARLPRIQMPRSFSNFGQDPPVPVIPIPKHAPKPGDPGYQYGFFTGAWKYWDDLEKRQGDLVSDGKRHWVWAGTVATGAQIMKFFYHLGGLGAVEQSADQVRWDVNRGANVGTIAWDSTKLAANTALAALNFVPVAGLVSKVGAGAKAVPTATVAATEAAPATSKVSRFFKMLLGSGDDAAREGQAALQGLEQSAGLTARVAAKLDIAAANQVKGELVAILEKAFPAGESGAMTAKQFNQVFAELKAYAGQHGIELTQMRETLGVFPKGLKEIGVSGFGALGDDAVKAGFGARHELAHLFHVIQTRVTIIKSLGQGGRIEAQALKDAETFLQTIEGGKNYLQFEKAVTSISSPVHGLSSRASDVGLYLERVKSLMDFTLKGLKAGKVVFPNGMAYEQVYALFISKAPIVVGKSAKELVIRFPAMLFGTLYASNTPLSAYGVTFPPGSKFKPNAGMRDVVNAFIAELGDDRGL